MATKLIHYTDGTSATFITDESWRTLKAAPLRIPNSHRRTIAAGPSLLCKAFFRIQFGDSPPYRLSFPSVARSGYGPPTLRTPALPFHLVLSERLCAKVAVCATVLIFADDHYTLYVSTEPRLDHDLSPVELLSPIPFPISYPL
ncbi:hypothetical protein BDN71DRAFT_1444666 [Pleurotus eryngii]|uniref:Uncharacterized protein n=1 Tax=Pleurotus eryngii TaxID=5323 RepID=A0A9P6A3E3_PLEER|nr:hypothetical protein BDN71DRAFT_1444666 [Pleurotus eryngii]